MTVQDMLNTVFRRMGAGRNPDSYHYADMLAGLQSMLRFWGSQGILVFASVQETVSVVGGRSAYTWGSAGNITTTRPHSITNALYRDSSGADYSIEVVTEDEFEAISDKTTSGNPSVLFLRKSYPLAIVNLWPVPASSGDMLVFDTLKPFAETSSFSALSDTIQFPVDYEALIINNLAVWMAPEYGITPPPATVEIAKETYRSISAINASASLAPIIMTDIIRLTEG